MIINDILENERQLSKENISSEDLRNTAQKLKKQMDEIEKTNTERTPKRGEIVEVADDESKAWVSAYFIATIDDYKWYKYICCSKWPDIQEYPTWWKCMRQKVEEHKKEETIYVPSHIGIEYNDTAEENWSDWLCINNGNQSLYYSEGIYRIGSRYKGREVKCKLVPIDVKDLEVGSTYFHTYWDNFDDIGDLMYYCKYLWENEIARRWGKSVHVNDITWKKWYKVVPID